MAPTVTWLNSCYKEGPWIVMELNYTCNKLVLNSVAKCMVLLWHPNHETISTDVTGYFHQGFEVYCFEGFGYCSSFHISVIDHRWLLVTIWEFCCSCDIIYFPCDNVQITVIVWIKFSSVLKINMYTSHV